VLCCGHAKAPFKSCHDTIDRHVLYFTRRRLRLPPPSLFFENSSRAMHMRVTRRDEEGDEEKGGAGDEEEVAKDVDHVRSGLLCIKCARVALC
jgi:hypothetical protein